MHVNEPLALLWTLEKNGQTFKNEKSLQQNLIILTIVETLKQNRIKVEDFFNCIFEHHEDFKNHPSKYLPWNKNFPENLRK